MNTKHINTMLGERRNVKCYTDGTYSDHYVVKITVPLHTPFS